jgi:hypothetical protein
MSPLTKAVVFGVASGLLAVAITVVIIGLMTNWENTHRPTFVREESAWFGVFSILSGLNVRYRERSPSTGS